MDTQNPQIGQWILNLFSALLRKDEAETTELTNAILGSICGVGYRKFLPLQPLINAPNYKKLCETARSKYLTQKPL